MKNIFHKLNLALLMFVFVTFITSCTKGNLRDMPTDGAVNISLDWSNLYSGDTIPSAVKYCFYGSKGNIYTEDGSSKGYSGSLPSDTYSVIIYNKDASNVTYSGFGTYSGAMVSAASATKAVATLLQPTYVYGVSIGVLTVSAGKTTLTTIKPLNMIKRADIKIIMNGDISSVTSCICSLEGISDGISPATGTLQSSSGIIGSSFNRVTDGYESTMTFFGCASGVKNNLNITTVLTGGSSMTTTVDISSELAKLSSTTVNVSIDVNITLLDNKLVATGVMVHDWNGETGGSANVN
jgi:hypothetical protein